MAKSKKLISVIIPCYNEEKNIDRTLQGLLAEGKKSPYRFEIIAVNDGSKDGTWNVIRKFAQNYRDIVAINQMDNFGQSQAYQAGFDHAGGEYIITCSADLETPLEYIHEVIKKLDEGYDFVNTNRVGRWGKERAVKSRLANAIINRISSIRIQDRGSGIKGMIAPVAKNMNLYGEMHRFLPDYARIFGARVVEFDTEFRERDYGKSSYTGQKRTIRVLLDLVTLLFMLYFARKPFFMMPGRLFGFTGTVMAFAGGIISAVLIFERIVLLKSLADRPLFNLGIFMVLLGLIMATLGMLGELMMRIYFEAGNRRPYLVREIQK